MVVSSKGKVVCIPEEEKDELCLQVQQANYMLNAKKIWKKCIEHDAEPNIPNFTGNPGINVELSENPNALDIELFLWVNQVIFLMSKQMCVLHNVLLLILNWENFL